MTTGSVASLSAASVAGAIAVPLLVRWMVAL